MREKYKWIIVYIIPFLYLVMCLYLCDIGSNYVAYLNNHKTAMNRSQEKPLRDNWKIVIGSLDQSEYSNIFLIFDLLPSFTGLVLIIWQIVALVQRRANYVIHLLFGEGTLLLVNGILHTATVFPDSRDNNPYCRDPEKAVYGSWIFYPSSIRFCGDMVWSGHTAHLLLCIIFIYWISQSYKSLNRKAFQYSYICIGLFLVLIEMNFLVIFSSHYTIDVVVAFLVVGLFLTHQKFHQYVDNYIYLIKVHLHL